VKERLSEELLEEMITEEVAWRQSEEAQRAMAAAELSGVRDWMRVVEDFQVALCLQFGFEEELDLGLRFLRSAASRVRHGLTDSRVLCDAPWIKFNRLQPCPIPTGALVPSVKVVPFPCAAPAATSLFDAKDVDSVVLASSVS